MTPIAEPGEGIETKGPQMLSEKLLNAAKNADWEWARQNGGPPCFHLDGEEFCLRAERWAGHPMDHKFTTLHKALLEAKNAK